MKRKFCMCIVASVFMSINMLNVCSASSGYGGFINAEEILQEKNGERFDAGQYKVGVDIPAGEYVVFAKDSGYFCVSSDSNGNDILFNDNFDYNSIITIFDGEYLELSRCYAIPFDMVEEMETGKTGCMFKVGTHIRAGEYKLDAGFDSGYYCIYSNSRHDYIIANDNFEGQRYVTVSDGQYLLLSRCTFETPPEILEKIYTDIDTVMEVQEMLNKVGYDCGVADGIAGQKTKNAISKYRYDNDMGESSDITDDLLGKLKENVLGETVIEEDYSNLMYGKQEPVLMGRYEQDNNLDNGVEDIEWEILTIRDNKALVISKHCLERMPFNESLESVTWEECTMRKWLNESFLLTTFSAEEQERIISTVVRNPDNIEHDEIGNDTVDKIFLLSECEAENYFLSNSQRKTIIVLRYMTIEL